VLALIGCAVDFALGILLHFNTENRILQLVPGPEGQMMVLNTAGLSSQAAVNWGFKETHGWVFWGDHFASLATPIQVLIVLTFAVLLHRMLRQAMAPGVDRWHGPRPERCEGGAVSRPRKFSPSGTARAKASVVDACRSGC